MKKLLILPLLLLCMLTGELGMCSAAVLGQPKIQKDYDDEYESSYRKKTWTSDQYKNGQYKEYLNTYDANTKVNRYTHMVKKLSAVVNYTATNKKNHCYPTIAITEGTSIAETSASSHTVGVEVSIEKKASFQTLNIAVEAGIKVTGNYSYMHTNSKTTTSTDSQHYSITLDKNSSVGKYYWAAMRDYDAVEVQVLRKNIYSVNQQWYVGDEYTIFPSIGDDEYYYQCIDPDTDLTKFK